MIHMADVALSPLLQVVFDRLASPILGTLHNLCGLEKNFQKLRKSLPMIQALLEDAEERQVTDKFVQMWLSKLKDAAYDSDDLLDELVAEVTLCESRSSIWNQVTRLLPFEPSRRLFDIASELEKMLILLDKITMEGLSLNFKERVQGGRSSESSAGTRETGFFVIESEVYGRAKDKENILKLLLPADCPGKTICNVSIIPIVGIGGLGKTTVAQLVYNDAALKQYFDVKIWVFVSHDFDVKKLIKAIIESATRRRCELLEMAILQSQLQETLCGKRYLLVLDDMWNEDQDEWGAFGALFRGSVEGSKILVTTRSDKVASIVGTTSPYHLKGLPEEDCLALFAKRAFGVGEEENHPNLLLIGRQIIKKCGGVPLAANTLGSLLRFKRDERDWLFVEESELFRLDECQNGILPTLRLSYRQLPPHLKRCFAYCSLFPKNYDIKKEKLIQLWMAEGLILGHGGLRPLEDIGNDYFNDLLWMSFFQKVQNGEDESMTVYKMHGLIHDLAQSVSGNEFVTLESALKTSNLSPTRHASILCNFESSKIPSALLQATRLRTLLLLSPGVSCGELPSLLPTDFTYLRVLDLSGSGIKVLQKSIGEFMCLRYLDLSNTSIQALPDTICNLFNLQTLDLSGCYHLAKLPDRIGRLISLRHLNITGCEGLTHMPDGIGKLVDLQTLPIYIVGMGSGASITELNCLKLRGELNIKCLENLRDAKEAKHAKLKEKKDLHTLGLLWGNNKGLKMNSAAGTSSAQVEDNKDFHSTGSSPGHDSNVGCKVEDILECLEPHPNLKKLFLKGFPGIKFPNWILPNLIVVVLINCKRCEKLPTLGHLPLLKTLYLQGMDNVKEISREFYGEGTQKPFVSLEELTLREFPNLGGWSGLEDREAFALLRKLVLNKCPNLISAPFFPSLQHVELQDCHTMVLNSMNNLSSLSYLVIDTFTVMESLSGEILKNNNSMTCLKISSCPNIHLLPSELVELTALKSLTISWCEKLSYLPQGLQNLKSLETLEISECHGLDSLPDSIGGLISLKVLSIENCDNLTSLSNGLQYLNALEHFTVMYCPKLSCFPDNFHNLLALRSFTILCCPELVSLPKGLQHVTTLQTLEIRCCPNLKNFPELISNCSSLRSLSISDCLSITSLPEGLQHISTLQYLSIQGCPTLEQKVEEEEREGKWEKMAHRSHIYRSPFGCRQIVQV